MGHPVVVNTSKREPPEFVALFEIQGGLRVNMVFSRCLVAHRHKLSGGYRLPNPAYFFTNPLAIFQKLTGPFEICENYSKILQVLTKFSKMFGNLKVFILNTVVHGCPGGRYPPPRPNFWILLLCYALGNCSKCLF